MFDFFGSMPTEDRLVFELSKLYEQYGYRKFCMAKFEEYSFYSDNRDFLSGEGVIAFNNSDGRLMALKPDITLSIVKNARIDKNTCTKAYYNENVYRISQETNDYKEIKQSGVELMGNIDSYSIGEIVTLALKSLQKIDSDCVLCLSHMAFISAVLDEMKLPASAKEQIIFCERNKNSHDLKSVCEQYGVEEKYVEYFTALTALNGSFDEVLQGLRYISMNDATDNACNELEEVYNTLQAVSLGNKVQLDLSVVNPSSYYNGIIFSGYVKASPTPVLAGGRYDNLASKIRKGIGAVGFAVYLDNLNLHYPVESETDCDILILNKSEKSGIALTKAVEEFVSQGNSVRVEKEIPENFKAGKTLIFDGKEVK
ncbi:MAG: ATP phosphoribosyltransferase regulatory subunit [Clostridia bacterium]|nr:ATP phosphoribosyltransferase regulatory subunit [Clostridia bacterium]